MTQSEQNQIKELTAEEMFHAAAKKQWLESPGFTPKMGSLAQIPHVCIPAIVELMEEYANQFKGKQDEHKLPDDFMARLDKQMEIIDRLIAKLSSMPVTSEITHKDVYGQ